MILDALTSRELPDGTLDPEDLAVRIEKKLYEVSARLHVVYLYCLIIHSFTQVHIFQV